MAYALAKGLIDSQVFSPNDIFISDPDKGQLQKCATLGVNLCESNDLLVKSSSVIVLSVKPYVVGSVLKEVSHLITNNKLISSIAAGVTIATLEKCLPPKTRVSRVMPNTASLVNASATAFALGTHCIADDGVTVRSIFKSIGTVHQVDETLMDAVVGLSGSGPAYVFMFIEALADGGVRMGLPRQLAMELATQTVIGAGKLSQLSGKHPGELKDMVCSPGGTTIAAVQALESGAFRATVMKAVVASANRAAEFANDVRSKL